MLETITQTNLSERIIALAAAALLTAVIATLVINRKHRSARKRQ
jgi:hypothetical protein